MPFVCGPGSESRPLLSGRAGRNKIGRIKWKSKTKKNTHDIPMIGTSIQQCLLLSERRSVPMSCRTFYARQVSSSCEKLAKARHYFGTAKRQCGLGRHTRRHNHGRTKNKSSSARTCVESEIAVDVQISGFFAQQFQTDPIVYDVSQ